MSRPRPKESVVQKVCGCGVLNLGRMDKYLEPYYRRNPYLVVRYHEGINDDFWRLCCDAMRENTTLVLYNDETMIPALRRFGVEEPEVYEYGFYGCNDPDIPGDEGGLRQVWINLAKPLELALHQGDYPMEPKDETNPREFEFNIDDRMTGMMTGYSAFFVEMGRQAQDEMIKRTEQST